MRLSARDSREWKAELRMISNQRHIDEVWAIMEPHVNEYADRYFADRMHEGGPIAPSQAVTLHIKKLILDNEKLHDTYHEIFDPESMEEYEEDTEGFKSVVLKKRCPVIANTLGSPVDDLKEWKAKFYGCKSQRLYDAFLNMTEFAAHYDEVMDEDAMNALDDVKSCRLSEMEDDDSEYGSGYLDGVLGYGIVANILNHMYPRTFPGSHRAGTWSLYFLSEGNRTIVTPTGTSEFTVVKDDHMPNSGNYETDHNFFLRSVAARRRLGEVHGLYVGRIDDRDLVGPVERLVGCALGELGTVVARDVADGAGSHASVLGVGEPRPLPCALAVVVSAGVGVAAPVVPC